MTEQKNLHYLNTMRVLACLMVLTLHTSSKQWYQIPLDQVDWLVATGYNSLVRCAFSLFFMISGVLFLRPEKEYPTKQLLCHNVPRIAVAFFFWSGFYLVVNHATGTPLELLRSWIYGHYHLGFLYALMAMYLCVPLLRPIAHKKETLEYFLLLHFFFVPCSTLLSLHPVLDEIIVTLSQKSHFQLVLGYTGFFFLGHYLHSYPLSKSKRILLYFCGFLSYLITITGTYFLSHQQNQPTETFFRYFLPTTYCVAISIFTLVQHLPHPISMVKIMAFLSPLTFGIYLLHDYFLVLFLLDFGWMYWDLSPLFNIPLFVTVLFVLCGSLIWLIRKIPIVGKWIA